MPLKTEEQKQEFEATTRSAARFLFIVNTGALLSLFTFITNMISQGKAGLISNLSSQFEAIGLSFMLGLILSIMLDIYKTLVLIFDIIFNDDIYKKSINKIEKNVINKWFKILLKILIKHNTIVGQLLFGRNISYIIISYLMIGSTFFFGLGVFGMIQIVKMI